MKNYRNLLIQVFLLIWLGMTLSYSAEGPIDYEQIRDNSKIKMGCCSKYGGAGLAVVSSFADFSCSIGALMPFFEDNTKRSLLLASDISSMVTFAARMWVLHSYITIFYKEMIKAQKNKDPTDQPTQKVEKDIFSKLRARGLTTAFTFIDIAVSMFACDIELVDKQTQIIISAVATSVVCALSMWTCYDLGYRVQKKYPGSKSSSRNTSNILRARVSSINEGSGSPAGSLIAPGRRDSLNKTGTARASSHHVVTTRDDT